ncbi:Isochorismate synthase DhbC [Halomonadaceae bacterium LMG 33818]|uniref:isochorismate synthase n=1 Tax=Cernens ardua TaxID=3402176 RepID=UPI003EDC60C5
MSNILLDHYTTDSFYFSSPSQTILTQQHLGKVNSPLSQVDQTIEELITTHHKQGHKELMIAGAFPFDQDVAGTLLVSEYKKAEDIAKRPTQNRADKKPLMATCPNALISVQPLPEKADYLHQVEKLLAMFARGEVEKVVLARAMALTFTHMPDPGALLRYWQQQEPNAFIFAMPLHDNDEPHVFCGASPELLIRKEGRHVTLNPLAGSTARHSTQQADQAAAAALLTSRKDHQEHAIVVEAIRRALAPFCTELNIPAAPELLATSKLWHLSTEIKGTLRDEKTSSLQIARSLHPTPAICGEPREAARKAIHQLEPFERGLFCGLIGWMKENGDGEWAISLRCADIAGQRVTLFAGAGVIAGSDPLSEFNETGTKLTTLLPALGVESAMAYLDTSWSQLPQMEA